MKLNALVVDPVAAGPLGWDFIERVCGMLPDLGVIVCTQGATVAQRVRGLRLGADDWVAKPCHPDEVMARIEAVVRRHRRGRTREDTGPLVAGELEVRPDRFQAYVGGESLELTRREFELLQVLADHGGKVMERDEIYQRVWGYAMIHGDRSVDVFVRKLRSKLQKRSPGWEYIHTHFGIGYRFDPQPIDRGRGRPLPSLDRGASAADERRPRPPRSERHEPSSRLELASRLRRELPGLRTRRRPCLGESLSGRRFHRFFTSRPQGGNRTDAGRWEPARDQLDEGAYEVISRKSILAIFACGLIAVGAAGCGIEQQRSTLFLRWPGHRRRQHVRRAADVEVAVRLRVEDGRHRHLRRDRLGRRDRADHRPHGRLRSLRRADDLRSAQRVQGLHPGPLVARRGGPRLQPEWGSRTT